jgi:hypothetical protein
MADAELFLVLLLVRVPDAGGGDIDSSGGATSAVGFAARRLVIATAATLSSSGELASSGEPAIAFSVPLRGSANLYLFSTNKIAIGGDGM